MDNIIFESPSKSFIREHQEEWKAEGRAEGRAEGLAEVQHELEEKNKIIEKLEAELKKIKALFPDLEKSYWLARKAMKEYNRLGKTVSPCPKCGSLPIVEIQGMYGETFIVKCPCGNIYLVERGI